MTNFERIKAMSVDEIAAWIPCPYMVDVYGECKFGWHRQEQSCEECKREWLESEVQDG